MWVKSSDGVLVNLENVSVLTVEEDLYGFTGKPLTVRVVALVGPGQGDQRFNLYSGDLASCETLLSDLAAYISINDRLLRIDDKGVLR